MGKIKETLCECGYPEKHTINSHTPSNPPKWVAEQLAKPYEGK